MSNKRKKENYNLDVKELLTFLIEKYKKKAENKTSNAVFYKK